MKHFLVLYILIILGIIPAQSQELTAEKIVSSSFLKFTNGKIPDSYGLKNEFLELKKIPAEKIVVPPVLALLDSMIQTLPDSERVAIQANDKMAMERYMTTIAQMKRMFRYYTFIKRSDHQYVSIHIQDNSFGKVDSSKVISPTYNNNFSNPLEFIYQLNAGLFKMNLVGKTTENNTNYWLVQVQQDEKWVDVYFDVDTKLIHKIVVPEIEVDPIFEKGPKLQKTSYIFSNYKKSNGLLLPESLEMLSTAEYAFTDFLNLTWLYLDKPIPDAIFKPVTPPTLDEIYQFKQLDEHITHLEKISNSINSRMLLVEKEGNKLSILGGISNNSDFNKELKAAVLGRFPNHTISEIYSLSPLSGYSSLSCFLDDSTSIYYPKKIGELARHASNYQDRCESTTFQVATQKGLLHEFEQEELNNPIQILLFNPNEIRPYFSLRVGYYLKDKEIFYLDGAVNEKRDLQATPIEKLLWDFIGSQNLKVKKIVFSNSYTDNQPATMSFEELQTRINRSSSSKSSDN